MIHIIVEIIDDNVANVIIIKFVDLSLILFINKFNRSNGINFWVVEIRKIINQFKFILINGGQ